MRDDEIIRVWWGIHSKDLPYSVVKKLMDAYKKGQQQVEYEGLFLSTKTNLMKPVREIEFEEKTQAGYKMCGCGSYIWYSDTGYTFCDYCLCFNNLLIENSYISKEESTKYFNIRLRFGIEDKIFLTERIINKLEAGQKDGKLVLPTSDKNLLPANAISLHDYLEEEMKFQQTDLQEMIEFQQGGILDFKDIKKQWMSKKNLPIKI